MTKFRVLKMYAVNDTPDHIVEEMDRVKEELIKAIAKVCIDTGSDKNIVMAALSFAHGAFVCSIVMDTDEAQKNARESTALGIYKNMEMMWENHKKKNEKEKL